MSNKCELCDNDASCVVVDLQQDGFVVDESGKKWETKKVHSTHLFCNDHKRKSITYGVDKGA